MPSISPLIIQVIDGVDRNSRRTRRGRKPARNRFGSRTRRG